MHPIFRIYQRDLRNIVTNWAAAVIIGGLVILPSLYAWFNIKASWDPYSHTEAIAIAVVNNDKGATLKGRELQLGDDIVASLHENKQMGWRFVDEATAKQQLQHGDVYASIIIPEDFSAKIATVLNDQPTKATIHYYVNEKINAIAPKITSKGASGIAEQISRNFIRVANGTIFRTFNQLGVELEQELPTIQKVTALIFLLERELPAMEHALNIAVEDATTAEAITQRARQTLPVVTELAQNGAQLAQGIGEFLGKSEQTLDQIEPAIKQDLQLLQGASEAVTTLLTTSQDLNAAPEVAASTLQRVKPHLQLAQGIADGLSRFFHRLDQALPGATFHRASTDFDQLSDRLGQQLLLIDMISRAIERGEPPAQSLLDELQTLATQSNAFLTTNLPALIDRLVPELRAGLDKAQASAQGAQTVLEEVNRSLPDVERMLQDVQNGVTTGSKELRQLQKDFPVFRQKVTQAADKIRAFEAKENIDEIINLLKNNYEATSQFFAEPVVLQEHKLFPIPNYGSAMSPFFSTLSLWVGALLLVSLLTVEVHEDPSVMAGYQSYHIYFGRFLTFWTISLLQSLVVTVGDIYVLGTYVADPLWFCLFGLLISSLFMLIVYTLVSVFGNVGKAMAIVLLVLQLAGSGGTFPIQLTPPFFQAINPYLPFTYAISMMREAVGGILWDIVHRDVLMLILYAVIFLIIGVFLKKSINLTSAALVKKAKESKLIH